MIRSRSGADRDRDPVGIRILPAEKHIPAGRIRPPGAGGAGRALVRGVTLAMATIAILAVGVLVVGPRFLPYRLVPVDGASMEPTIHLGSLAVMRPVTAKDVRVGDIIIFGRADDSGILVTHRVVSMKRTSHGLVWYTKGDANGATDPWYVPAEGSGWRYSFSIPGIGYVLSGLGSGVVRAAIGMLLLIALVVWILEGIWRPRPAPAAG